MNRKHLLALVLGLYGSLLASTASAALEIFACEPEWAALAQELGGDAVEVYAATHALQDVHRIQARPSLIARYRQANLVICTGADLELGWLPALRLKANNPRVAPGTPGYLEASAYVTMREVPVDIDRSHGDVHPAGNPHIQTDPRNMLLVAQALSKRLQALDSAHAGLYAQRHTEFSERWQAAIAAWQAQAAPLRGVGVVTAHRSWTYLFDWLGLVEIASLEPKPGIPASAAHLATVLDQLKSRPAAMVLHAAYQDPRSAQWIAERAHIARVELPFTVGGSEDADDLMSLYAVSVARLLAAAQ